MTTFRRCAVFLLAAGLLTAGAAPGHSWPDDGKDWFGRPLEPCEPKCHWQWWLGRKHPPNMGPETAARPEPARETARKTERPERRSVRHARSRPPASLGAPAWRATPFDLASAGLMGAPSPEALGETGAPGADGRVAASFAPLAAVVVRRVASLDEPGATLVASAASAAPLGDLAPEIEGAGLRDGRKLVDLAEGLDQVEAGGLAGLVVRAETAPASRLSLADRPDLVALPLDAVETAAPLDIAHPAPPVAPAVPAGHGFEPAGALAPSAEGPAAQAFETVATAAASAAR